MSSTIKETLEEYWEKRDKQLEEDKKNYKGPHCCLIMEYSVDETDPENVSPVVYRPKFREYYLKATVGLGAGKIDFCHYCGTRLPAGLSDAWFDILEEEYGWDNPAGPQQGKKIPTEFLTDGWWKKRGL